MKRYILLIILFANNPCIGYSQQWNELNDSLNHYYNEGNYEKAILFGERALAVSKISFGKTHDNYINTLKRLRNSYKNNGNIANAAPVALLIISFYQNKNDTINIDYATALNQAGLIFEQLHDDIKTEKYYLYALSITRRLQSNENLLEAILYNLGDFYQTQNKMKKAILLFEEKYGLVKKNKGEDDPDYATGLNRLGSLYENLLEYQKAEPLYLKAMAIRKKNLGDIHPDYAVIVYNLAGLYESKGEYTKAEQLYLEASNVWKKSEGIEHPHYASALNNLGYLYNSMGEYAKAESFYIEAITIRKKILGENNPDYAGSLNNLATVYKKMGEYVKAETLYAEALNIRKRVLGETHPDYATSLNNLGSLYINIGNFSKAELLYIEALSIRKNVLGEKHQDYATSLNNLGGLYETMGAYEKAEKFYLQSIDIYKKLFGSSHIYYATELNNLALLYQNMHNYKKAESLLTEALSIRKRILGQTHPNYASSLNNLAGLYETTGNFSKAKLLYTQALDIRKKVLSETHPDYAVSLNNLAGLYENLGDLKIAEDLRIKGTRISLNHLLANFSNLSEKEKEDYVKDNRGNNESLLSLQFRYDKISKPSRKYILDQQLLLKSLILADTKNLLQTIQNNSDSNLQKIYSSWLSVKKKLSQQYSLPLAKRSDQLLNWEKQAEEQEKKLNSQLSAFRDQQKSIQVKTEDVLNSLNNNEVAIEFIRFQLYNKKWTDSTIYAAYIVNKNDSIPIFVPLCEEKQLQKLFDSAGTTTTAMVSKFYRGLEINSKNAAGALGTELYKLIWQPLEPYLKGVKKVSYSPAGKLYSIAFHALPVDSTTVLMDKYQLQQYTSTRQVVLREQEKQNIKPESIALFGDASFTLDSLQIVKGKTKTGNVTTSIYTTQNRGTRGGTWSSLPGTAQEVKAIQQVFEENKLVTKTFTQTSASEENLKAFSGNSPQILHLATHGFFLPEPDKKRKENNFSNENTYTLADDPLLRSGLILAGGNYAWSGKTPIEGVEDGIATAYEISQLNLSNTELVVLSACETALGDVKGSEGVFGLQRAFKMAGVKKMIVSLWQVPDKETAELMTSFYTYWMKSKSINDAFAQAQADMRKKYSPFYWAAFVLVE